MPSLNILVVEDHDVLRESIVQFLRGLGYQVAGVSCAEDVDDSLPDRICNLFVIDVNLPGENGLSLARRIRRAEPGAGIIVMTGRNQLADRLDSFVNGADVFLTKPLAPDELAACVASMANRLAPLVRESNLQLDVSRQRLSGRFGEIRLSRKETLLLAGLNRASDHQLERWQAMEYVDPQGKGLSPANLEMCIAALRRKLLQVGADDPTILTVRGVGYRLCAPLHTNAPVRVWPKAAAAAE